MVVKFILFLIPFFKPNYIIQISWLNQIYNIAQIGISFFVIIEFLKKRKLSYNLLYILAMEIVIFISSIINNLEYMEVVKNVIQTLVLCMMIELFAVKDLKKLFLSLKIILTVLVTIDFLFVLKYPLGLRVGLYNIWFFGAKNGHLTFILPAVFCTYINNFIINKINKKRIFDFIFLLFISCYILITVNSATSIIVLLVFIVLMLISNNKLYSKLSMKIISIIYVLLFLCIVFFQIQNNFSGFIENVFDKDSTFTGRTEIWEKSIDYIKNKPILGYGLEPSDIRVIKMNNIAALNSHNMILEIFYEGGLVLMTIFTCFWIKFCKEVDKYSKKNNQILKSIVIAYLVQLLTEVFAFEILLWVFILVYQIAHQSELKGE